MHVRRQLWCLRLLRISEVHLLKCLRKGQELITRTQACPMEPEDTETKGRESRPREPPDASVATSSPFFSAVPPPVSSQGLVVCVHMDQQVLCFSAGGRGYLSAPEYSCSSAFSHVNRRPPGISEPPVLIPGGVCFGQVKLRHPP